MESNSKMMNDTCNNSSLYGYHNIIPRTREERRNLTDKVALEKSRLNQRVGYAARIHQANAPMHTSELTSCVTGGAGYLSNADRFHTDTAGEEYQRRMQQIEKQKRIDEFKRNQVFQRDEERFRISQEAKIKEEEYWQKLRDDGLKAKKNQSMTSYDILSLEYNPTIHGEYQKYKDDMIKYRAILRAKALVENGDTRVPYNIINGTSRHAIEVPPVVQKPNSIVEYNTRHAHR